MIAKDAILLNLYTCKGRNYRCDCEDCVSLCISVPKKIDWKTLIHLNGNIKGGKSFIRRELPKYSNDKKIITEFKELEEAFLSLRKAEMRRSALPTIVEKEMMEAWRKSVKMDKGEFRKFMKWKDKNNDVWIRTKNIIQQIHDDTKLQSFLEKMLSKDELGKWFEEKLST